MERSPSKRFKGWCSCVGRQDRVGKPAATKYYSYQVMLFEQAMQQLSVTSKGQVTIPKNVRQELGIRAGTQVTFQVVGDHVEMRPVHAPSEVPSSGFGLLRSNKKPVPADFDAAALTQDP